MHRQFTTIGSRNSKNQWYFPGAIDEVRVYSRVLTPSQIRDMYLYQSAWVQDRQSHDITVDNDSPTAAVLISQRQLPGQAGDRGRRDRQRSDVRGGYGRAARRDSRSDDCHPLHRECRPAGRRLVRAVRASVTGHLHPLCPRNGPRRACRGGEERDRLRGRLGAGGHPGPGIVRAIGCDSNPERSRTPGSWLCPARSKIRISRRASRAAACLPTACW